MEVTPNSQTQTEVSRFQASPTTEDGNKTHVAITIGLPPMEIYAFWRDFQNLPKFLKDVQDIRILSGERSHWVIRLSSGFLAEWDATITADVPGQRLAWRSDPGSDVETHGDIRFEPASSGEGSVVRLSMTYHIPGGRLTELVTFFSGEDPRHPRHHEFETAQSGFGNRRVSHGRRSAKWSRRRSRSKNETLKEPFMRALCWEGKQKIEMRTVRDPSILRPKDAILKVTTAAICGSDLHLYDGYIPTMQKGDILGHETMGEVMEVGPAVRNLKVGDKVVVAFDIGCGSCAYCQGPRIFGLRQLESEFGFGRQALRLFGLRNLWILAPLRRLRRWPGRIHPRSLRRHQLLEGAEGNRRRKGSFFKRYFPDRLHGGRKRRHQTWRYRGDLGSGTRRTDGDS